MYSKEKATFFKAEWGGGKEKRKISCQKYVKKTLHLYKFEYS